MLKRSVLFSLIFLLLMPFAHAAKKKRELVENQVAQSVLSENDRRMFDYYFNEAIQERYASRFDEALALFKHCLAIDSLNAQVWFELSVFYNNMKRADLGLEAFEKAYALDPKNDWYAMGLANAYLNLKMFDKAISLYEVLVKSRPTDETIRYYLATLYKQENQLQHALREYNLLEKQIGKNEQVSIFKYDVYKKLNKPKKAIKEIQEFVKSNPALIDSHLLLGDSWFDLGNVENAYKVYMVAYAMDSTSPAVALTLADYYSRTGDSIKSNQQLIKALTNPNTDIETKLEIFSPMLSQALGTGDSTQIAHYFSILLAQHPNEPILRNVHVEYLMAVGRKNEAKEELRTVLDLNPLQLDVWKQLLQLSAEADNQNEIQTICKEALTHYPNESVFWFYLALSYYPNTDAKPMESDYDIALTNLKKASEVANKDDAPFLSRIYGLMGDIHLSLKKAQPAYEYYDKALSIYPTNLLVLNNYAYYLSEDNQDLIKAEKMSRMTIDAEPKNPTFLDTYAWIFFKQGKYGLAKIYMERALANEPAPSSILVEHYGDILWFNGEKDAALEQWKKALELEDPTEELAQKVEKGMYVKQLNSQK